MEFADNLIPSILVDLRIGTLHMCVYFCVLADLLWPEGNSWSIVTDFLEYANSI